MKRAQRLVFREKKDRCLFYRLGLQGFYRFFYKFYLCIQYTHAICILKELLVALHTGPEEIPSLTTL